MTQISKHSLSERGVFIARSKGSFDEITTWTPRLRQAINYAIELRQKIINKLIVKNKPIPLHSKLFIKRTGEPLTHKDALDSAWQRIVKKLINAEIVTSDNKFTFHDIKAAGVTNHPLHESGHKSEKAKAVYLRGTKEVIATE
ncbi:MAG: hypothetical protein U9R28_05215 [Pseudomonadota bacterium]|nr:hypothetical protein [Pseudomonadota bacterium]